MYTLIRVIQYVLIGIQSLSYIMVHMFDVAQFNYLASASITANLIIVSTKVVFLYLNKKEVLK